MLDTKLQSQLVDATSAMMRAYVVAATRSWTASATGGLVLWASMLGVAASRDGVWPEERRPADAMTPAATIDAGFFSSYRSDGGHAVAQIVAPGMSPLV
jgi:hypothetical protein